MRNNNIVSNMYTRHYTSIDESKKLLSLGLKAESADMLYTWDTDNKTYYPLPIVDDKEHDFPSGLPCWSLSALLSVLPFDDFTTPQLIGTPKTLYRCVYNGDLKSHAYENPVDACYDMIIHLNELKML